MDRCRTRSEKVMCCHREMPSVTFAPWRASHPKTLWPLVLGRGHLWRCQLRPGNPHRTGGRYWKSPPRARSHPSRYHPHYRSHQIKDFLSWLDRTPRSPTRIDHCRCSQRSPTKPQWIAALVRKAPAWGRASFPRKIQFHPRRCQVKLCDDLHTIGLRSTGCVVGQRQDGHRAICRSAQPDLNLPRPLS